MVPARRSLALPAAPVLRHRNGFRPGAGRRAGASTSGFRSRTPRSPGCRSGVDPAAALLIGDNLATGWVAMQRAGVRPGDVVAIIGGGPVGQLAAWPRRCTAPAWWSCPIRSRTAGGWPRRRARWPPNRNRCASVIDELTDGRGADAVVEAVGGARGLDAALDAVRAGGVVVSVSAHSQASWEFPLARSFAAEVTVRVRDRRLDPGRGPVDRRRRHRSAGSDRGDQRPPPAGARPQPATVSSARCRSTRSYSIRWRTVDHPTGPYRDRIVCARAVRTAVAGCSCWPQIEAAAGDPGPTFSPP